MNEKVETWNDIHIKQKRVERVWLLIMGNVLVIGIISEVLVRHGVIVALVSDYASISLAVLQIQATIYALTIALLALLTGKMTESHMGINWNDFLLNCKPVFFKQKRILYGTLILLVINIGAHMLQLYNIVLAVFVVVCTAIGVSIGQIYSVFTENEKIQEEIKQYVLGLANNEQDVDLLQRFGKDWEKKIENQQWLEYEDWEGVFEKIFEKELLRNASEARTRLQDICVEIIRCALESNRDTIKERGMELINVCYCQIYRTLSTRDLKRFEDGFYLFEHIFKELKGAMEALPIKIVEKRLNWSLLGDKILRANFEIAVQNEKAQNERATLINFMQYMAYYLAENKNQNYDARAWGEILLRLYYYGQKDYTTDTNMVNGQRARMMLAFAIGLVKFQMFDFLKDTLYMRAFRYTTELDCEHYAYMVLELHCYIYYIAYYESLNRVSKELKEDCRKFLDDEEIKIQFSNFLDKVDYINGIYAMDDGTDIIFNKKMGNRMYEELKGYECWPKYESWKQVVIDNVVRNFEIFLALYMERQYYRENLLEQMISDVEVTTYYEEYVKQDKKSDLIIFLTCIGVPVDKRDEESEVMLQKLKRIIIKKFKTTEIERGRAKQKKYEEAANEEDIRAEIIYRIRAGVKSKFASILLEQSVGAEMNQTEEILYRCNTYTEVELEKSMDGSDDWIAGIIIKRLINSLIEKGNVIEKSRNDLADEEYVAYLKNNHPTILIGSEYSFEPEYYKNQVILNEYLQDKEYIFAGNTAGLLLLNEKVNIYIKDINVNIRPGKIDDEDVCYDVQTEKYTYEIMYGVPVEFTGEELEEFLYNNKKIIEVNVKFGIQDSHAVVGEVLWR